MRPVSGSRGLALIELIVTLVILSILASLILPSAQMTAKRTKEIELRRELRAMRTALDEFKRTYDEAIRNKQISQVENLSGYPKELKVLVEGYDFGGPGGGKKKFLRKIPVDPFNSQQTGEEPKWGLRSYKDDPDSTTWGGEDVFDIYSLSEETAIDGTKYKDW
jgi:general secretion pathway protein G